jgi:hypothetical protein
MPLDVLEAHEMRRSSLAHSLARQSHHPCRSINGNDPKAVFGEGQSVSSHATASVQNASTKRDLWEEALVNRLHVHVCCLRCEGRSISVVVAYGVGHRVSHRWQPRLAPTDGLGGRERYAVAHRGRTTAPQLLAWEAQHCRRHPLFCSCSLLKEELRPRQSLLRP